jgi:hypothetical protein
MSYYHFLALSLVIFPPFYFHNYIIYFNNGFHLRWFRICCVVLQVVYHVLTVGVLNNLSQIVHSKDDQKIRSEHTMFASQVVNLLIEQLVINTEKKMVSLITQCLYNSV